MEPKKYLARLESLESDRRNWEYHWQEIAEVNWWAIYVQAKLDRRIILGDDMKLTKTKLQQMWRRERRTAVPSPERDHLLSLSFKQWVRENAKKYNPELTEETLDYIETAEVA